MFKKEKKKVQLLVWFRSVFVCKMTRLKERDFFSVCFFFSVHPQFCVCLHFSVCVGVYDSKWKWLLRLFECYCRKKHFYLFQKYWPYSLGRKWDNKVKKVVKVKGKDHVHPVKCERYNHTERRLKNEKIFPHYPERRWSFNWGKGFFLCLIMNKLLWFMCWSEKRSFSAATGEKLKFFLK